jgi:hypothetical protein
MKLNKMNINKAEDFANKALVVLEGINRMQVEKDAIIESYHRIKQEYGEGRISFATYSDAVHRMNAELQIIDKNIEEQIRISDFSADSISKYVKLQKPVRIKLVAEKS